MADQPTTVTADTEKVEEPRSSPLKSPRVRVALLVGAIVILVAGFLWYSDRQSRGIYMQGTDNAYIAADSVVVAPKIAGYVEHALVSENQAVRQGQPLAELDPWVDRDEAKARADFLPGYRAYVHVSYSESSSLAIIEAMAERYHAPLEATAM